MTTNVGDGLRQIAALASTLASQVERRRSDEHPLAADVLRGLVPEARLYAYQGRNYEWYAHLLMPRGWTPRPEDRRTGWMSPDAESYWTSVSGDSEREVLLAGLHVLLDAATPRPRGRGVERDEEADFGAAR